MFIAPPPRKPTRCASAVWLTAVLRMLTIPDQTRRCRQAKCTLGPPRPGRVTCFWQSGCTQYCCGLCVVAARWRLLFANSRLSLAVDVTLYTNTNGSFGRWYSDFVVVATGSRNFCWNWPAADCTLCGVVMDSQTVYDKLNYTGC